jgi:hypothetical protein
MDEKCSQSRPRALKGARIVFGNRSRVIDCTIRNRSSQGARLSLPSIVGVPDQFELHDKCRRREAERYSADTRSCEACVPGLMLLQACPWHPKR